MPRKSSFSVVVANVVGSLLTRFVLICSDARTLVHASYRDSRLRFCIAETCLLVSSRGKGRRYVRLLEHHFVPYHSVCFVTLQGKAIHAQATNGRTGLLRVRLALFFGLCFVLRLQAVRIVSLLLSYKKYVPLLHSLVHSQVHTSGYFPSLLLPKARPSPARRAPDMPTSWFTEMTPDVCIPYNFLTP